MNKLCNFRPSDACHARLQKLWALNPGEFGWKSYIIQGLLDAAMADMREAKPGTKSHCATFRAELAARVDRVKSTETGT